MVISKGSAFSGKHVPEDLGEPHRIQSKCMENVKLSSNSVHYNLEKSLRPMNQDKACDYLVTRAKLHSESLRLKNRNAITKAPLPISCSELFDEENDLRLRNVKNPENSITFTERMVNEVTEDVSLGDKQVKNLVMKGKLPWWFNKFINFNDLSMTCDAADLEDNECF